jgi:dynein intermediate chain 3, axonemal
LSRGYRPPVRLERSSFFNELLLTIYDFHFSIWSQGVDRPLYHSAYTSDALITCGAASPSRPGVVLIGRSDGKLELWDFLEQSHKWSAITDLQVQTFLTALEFQIRDREKMKVEQFVAVGDGQGVARIFSVPKNFRVPGSGEENNMKAFWARQKSRLDFMKGRNEVRRKQKQDEELERLQREEELARGVPEVKVDVFLSNVILM